MRKSRKSRILEAVQPHLVRGEKVHLIMSPLRLNFPLSGRSDAEAIRAAVDGRL
jgi:hypothetical protein